MLSTRLARNGWYSTGINDTTRCYFCQALHNGWRRGDNPGMFHNHQCVMFSIDQEMNNRQSYNFSENRSVSNVLMENDNMQQMTDVVPIQEETPHLIAECNAIPVSIPSSDREENITDENKHISHLSRTRASTFTSRRNSIDTQVRRRSSEETDNINLSHGSTPDARRGNNHPDYDRKAPETHSLHQKDTVPSIVRTQSNTSTARESLNFELKTDIGWTDFCRLKYPFYSNLEDRIGSFTDWPASKTQTPRDLALAGFFYAGDGDSTRCFDCGVGLRNWDAEDDPWVEHARWSPNCRFVNDHRGSQFLDAIEEKWRQLRINAQTTDDKKAEEEKIMKSRAGLTLTELGYSKEKIMKAVNTLKQRLSKEKQKVSTQEILEVINELEDNNIDNTQSPEPPHSVIQQQTKVSGPITESLRKSKSSENISNSKNDPNSKENKIKNSAAVKGKKYSAENIKAAINTIKTRQRKVNESYM
ncbi:inhibitor of apoptosis protein-like [Saccostrea echinata]|uniref:inhibitor of apoptosis protein-like n=1 Tax=Saccostrea echinata TaxID=191078 RepID=UPI002A800F09|nr:inhibitor of apoptosis protein-like [Saccostrea echinata]